MDGNEAYKRWHWGVGASEKVKVNAPSVIRDDEDLERWKKMQLVECGRLVEIHYAPFGSSRPRKDKIIKLDRKNSNECHLAFDKDHPNQRLYFILNAATRKKMKKTLHNDYDYITLNDLSEAVGGRHSQPDYDYVEVQPIGVMTNVVYACEKKGDGYSFYIHSLGEESGIKPVLAMSKDGSLWFAGGNYTSPTAGITD